MCVAQVHIGIASLLLSTGRTQKRGGTRPGYEPGTTRSQGEDPFPENEISGELFTLEI